MMNNILFKKLTLLLVVILTLSLVGCDLINPDDDDNDDSPGGSTGSFPGAGTLTNPFLIPITGGASNGSITTTQQAVYYSFTASGRYDITVRDNYYRPTNSTTSPYTVDIKASVIDTNTNYIPDINNRAMDHIDMGGNNDDKFVLTDKVGVYLIMITPYSTGQTGTFRIELAKTGSVTAGEGQADAIDITNYTPTPFELEVTSSRPARWFKFTADGRYDVTVRDNYYVPTNATASPYTVDLRVTAMDSNLGYISDINNRAMNGIDLGGNTNDTFILTDKEGVFYIKIDPYIQNYYGSFGITLARTGNVTAGAGQADAIPLVLGAPRVMDEVTSTRPARWFTFIATGSTNLTMFDSYYTSTGINDVVPTLDAVVTVMDANLSYVNDSNNQPMNRRDIGATNQSPVIVNTTAGSVYYVKIDPYSANYYGSFYVRVE